MSGIKIAGGIILGFNNIDEPLTKYGSPGTNIVRVWWGGALGGKILAKMKIWEADVIAKAGKSGDKISKMPFQEMALDDNPNEPGVLLTLRHNLLDRRDKSVKPLNIKHKGRSLPMEKDGCLCEGLNPGDGTELDVTFRQYPWSFNEKCGFSLALVELDFQLIMRKEPGSSSSDGSFSSNSAVAVWDENSDF